MRSVFVTQIITMIIANLPWDGIKTAADAFLDKIEDKGRPIVNLLIRRLRQVLDIPDNDDRQMRGTQFGLVDRDFSALLDVLTWEEMIPALDALLDVIEDKYGDFINYLVGLLRDYANIPDNDAFSR